VHERGTALGMRKDPVFIGITIVMTMLLLLFVVYPVFSVLVKSFRYKEQLSLLSYASFFKYSYYYRSMVNTLILGVVTTATEGISEKHRHLTPYCASIYIFSCPDNNCGQAGPDLFIAESKPEYLRLAGPYNSPGSLVSSPGFSDGEQCPAVTQPVA